MFFRIISKSLWKRKRKVLFAILSVLIGSMIASALITVSIGIGDKVSTEFRKFGANLLIVPKSDTIDIGFGSMDFGSITEQKYIEEDKFPEIKRIHWQKNVMGYAPFLYQVVDVSTNDKTQKVVLTGTYFEKETILDDGTIFKTGIKTINSWWHIEGDWADDSDDSSTCVIGMSVAEILNIGVGSEIIVSYKTPTNFKSYIEDGEKSLNNSKKFKVTGIIMTGGLEDNQIFITLNVAQKLTDRNNKVHTGQVSALCTECPIEEFVTDIEHRIPDVSAKTVKQIADAEMNLLHKTESMMLLVTIITLIASGIGVMTTMTASVLERQKEIGLMKSIGAEKKSIASLFLFEALIIGLLGGIIGYFVGIFLAQVIAISVFESNVYVNLYVLPIIISISIAISLLASILPVIRALKIEPAIVLRGE